MKKFLLGLIMLAVFAVTLPLTADAQTCRTRKRKAVAKRSYAVRGYQYQKRSYWQRHPNVRNIALATGGGAILGGLLGGRRKSMLKGAVVGAGAGALYTYVIRPKRSRY